jgi:hypothetical protein
VSPRIAAIAALAAAGCAGTPVPGRPPFTFPDAFDVNQSVTVRADGVTHELVASLRRRSASYDVTLFDPAFGVPLLSASMEGAEVLVREGASPERRGDAEKLLAMLRELYGETYRPSGADRAEASAGKMRYRLTGIRSRDGCAFPDRIEVRPRLGSAVAVDVVTLDVSCATAGGRPD